MDDIMAYERYLALRAHFHEDHYDFFRYVGKTKANSAKALKRRKDKQFFGVAAKNYNLERWTNCIIVASTQIERVPPPKDLIEDELIELTDWWTERIHNQEQAFVVDLQKIRHSWSRSLDELLDMNVRTSQPLLLEWYYTKKVPADTLIIINSVVENFREWDAMMNKHPLWPSSSRYLRRLTPFIDFDTSKAAKHLLTFFPS